MKVDDIQRFVSEQSMSDPEFARAMRYYTGSLTIAIDDKETSFEFNDGKLVADAVQGGGQIVVRGTQEQWDCMLEAFPKPFYQCLQTTSIRHGLYLNNTNEMYAYLPALNRLTTLLRQESIRLIGAGK